MLSFLEGECSRAARPTAKTCLTLVASVWNFEAYEARERAGVPHTEIYMAVLIQEGINSESSGVMITADPYNREDKDAIYISAKRGLGIKVVEGQRIAEQVVFR